MILSYSDPQFMQRTISGEKVLSFREDKYGRWKIGRAIQFWMHNPRNIQKTPFQFGTGTVLQIRTATIDVDKDELRIEGNKYRRSEDLERFAKQDGFDSWDACKAFHKNTKTGVLISWTSFKQVDRK